MEDNNYNENKINVNKNKLIMPTFIAIVTLLLLSVGATYAYIKVQTTDNFATPTISGTTPKIGSVALKAGTSLSLSPSISEMMIDRPATYYATTAGTSTTNSNWQTIGTATVSGEGTYTCDYTIAIKGTGNLLTNSKNLGNDLLLLEVQHGTDGAQNTTYDFNDTSGDPVINGTTLTGKLTGLSQSTPKTITARFRLVNSESQNQTQLSGTSATISFTLSSFSCTATA